MGTRRALWALMSVVVVFGAAVQAQESDPYEKYVKTSKDFKPVKQDKAWALKAWPRIDTWAVRRWFRSIW